MALLHLGEHVQTLQHPVGVGDERLADMEAREMLAFEELDLETFLGDQRGRRGAGRAAADDEGVGLAVGHMSPFAPTGRLVATRHFWSSNLGLASGRAPSGAAWALGRGLGLVP